MFLGQINDYLVPSGEANTIIPIRTIASTNDNVVNKRGVISFLRNGKYNVDATISVSATETQNVNVSIFTDDGIRLSVPATIPAPPDGETVGIANVSLVDAINVVLTKYFNTASIYIGVDQSDVTVNGYIRIEHFK
jgi:hypothetical protein